MTASTYKDKFRTSKRYPNETFIEFYTRSLNHFEHWCQMERVNDNFQTLVDMILREQLINSSSKDLQVWLKERQPKSSDEMIELAEAYQNAHRGSGSMTRAQTHNNQRDNRGNVSEQKALSGNMQNKHEKNFIAKRHDKVI